MSLSSNVQQIVGQAKWELAQTFIDHEQALKVISRIFDEAMNEIQESFTVHFHKTFIQSIWNSIAPHSIQFFDNFFYSRICELILCDINSMEAEQLLQEIRQSGKITDSRLSLKIAANINRNAQQFMSGCVTQESLEWGCRWKLEIRTAVERGLDRWRRASLQGLSDQE